MLLTAEGRKKHADWVNAKGTQETHVVWRPHELCSVFLIRPKKKLGVFRVPLPKKIGSVGRQNLFFFFFAKSYFVRQGEQTVSVKLGMHQIKSKSTENAVLGLRVKKTL